MKLRNNSDNNGCKGKRISELEEKTQLQGTEYLAYQEGEDNGKLSLNSLKDYLIELVQEYLINNGIIRDDYVQSEPAFKLLATLPELIADRACKDEFGNNINDTYLTREAVKAYVQSIYEDLFTENPPHIMDGYITVDMLSEAVLQLLNSGGAITNFPDEEDLTVKDGKLKFNDKEYDPNKYSGLGRVMLRRNMVDGVNVLTQEMMSKPNTRYIIQYDFDLRGETINVPDNCVLEFEGGSLGNGTLNGSNTVIIASIHCIFNVINLTGKFVNNAFHSKWFGSFSEESDCTTLLQNSITNTKSGQVNTLIIDKGIYNILDTIFIPSYFNFGGLSKDSNPVWESSSDLPTIIQNTNKNIIEIQEEDGQTTARNVYIHDIILSVKEGIESNSVNGIYTVNTINNSSFKNIYINKCNYGININIQNSDGAAQNIFENLALTYNTIGFYLKGDITDNQKPWFNQNTFRNCYINDNRVGGIFIHDLNSVQTLLIEHCNIENNGNNITQELYDIYGNFGIRIDTGIGYTVVTDSYIENNYPRINNTILNTINKKTEGSIILDRAGTIKITNCVISQTRQFILVSGAGSVTLINNDYYLYKIDDNTSNSLVRYSNINNASVVRLIINEGKPLSSGITQAYEFDYTNLNSSNTFYNSYIDIKCNGLEEEVYYNRLYQDNSIFYINDTTGNANYTGLSISHPFKTIRNISSYGNSRFINVNAYTFSLQADLDINQQLEEFINKDIKINGNNHIINLAEHIKITNSNLYIKDCTINLSYPTEYFNYIVCQGNSKIVFENCIINFLDTETCYLVDAINASTTQLNLINCTINVDLTSTKSFLTMCRDYSTLKVSILGDTTLPTNLNRNDTDFISHGSVEYNNPVNIDIKRYETGNKFVYSDSEGTWYNLDGTLWDKVTII